MPHYLQIALFIALALGTATADEPRTNLLTPRAKSAKEPALQRELLDRVKVDQDARMASIEWMKRHSMIGGVDAATLSEELKSEYERLGLAMKQADEENTKRLAEIVEQHGWPTNTLVGPDGANAAWLLVQHADRDRKFQRTCLDLMTKLPKQEVSQRDLAYLTDRVLLGEGKKQLYGTQMDSADGKWAPRPLEDPENVDQRRAEHGLEPLAEYIKQMESFYGPAPSK
ncbi:MAG TPA: DUF6624 domain-containing protein [Pirellulaceae bacterium]